MKYKADITIGVITKVREYYKTDKKAAGLLKVDKLLVSNKIGSEIHIYYEDLTGYDSIYVNGVRFAPELREDSQAKHL